MEEPLLYISISIILLLLGFKLYNSIITSKKITKITLPPTPPYALPIIGHLHLIKQPFHRTLQNLSFKYGDVFSLWFGSRHVVIVSSPSAVEECFTKNDIVLANRPPLLLGKHLAYNYTTITQSPYGDHWRNLRRIGAIEIFSSTRLKSFSGIRRDEVKRLLLKLIPDKKAPAKAQFLKVEMKSLLSELTYNIMMRMVAQKRYYGDNVSDQKEAERFREIMKKVVAYGGAANPGDFLPILNWFGGKNSFEKRVKRLAKNTDEFLQGVRRIVLLTAGTDTSSVTLEWAISNLLNNPHILKKAKSEIDDQIGQNYLMDESDLLKLPYLQNIISETLRLYPAAPLLVPHYSSQDCTIQGYDIPHDTILLVNAWAIHRDPKIWGDDVESFNPTRFELESEESGKLVNKLMPFGLGRRACPGSGLAQRLVGLTLGCLIQCFDWERISDEELDMSEGKGVTMPKAVPLEAMCKARPIMNLYSKMEQEQLYTALIGLVIVVLVYKLFIKNPKRQYKNLPPSPPYPLPLIGHLHLIKPPVHRCFCHLATKYGAVFTLWFGSNRVVVISSRSAAEECFTKNDIVLANRIRSPSAENISYNHSTVISASYGDHWRNLRKIGSIEIFSASRLKSHLDTRTDEIKRMLIKLSQNSLHYGSSDKNNNIFEFNKVEMMTMFSNLTFNIIMRMVAGKRYWGDDVSDEEEAKKFRKLKEEVIPKNGVINPLEFLPGCLSWIGIGYVWKMNRVAKRMDGFLQGLIDERRSIKGDTTMIDHMLALQTSDPHYYTDQIIKGYILVLLLAATGTSSATLEWALTNLLNNPHILEKAKAEIDEQIGEHKLIEEQDLSKLPYLQNIIHETLRLFPAAPMLLPHYSSEDCIVEGYDIPRDTIVMVNAWAIHRDPKLWEDPESFKPERFENSEGVNNINLLMPFGLGRRSCPGNGMANRVLGLTLGCLIQCFEWKRVSEEKIDLTEGKGVTVSKAIPLEAMCKALI
ncbi:hypothetical protein G4B88_006842 [Cannabis sativa]|uniref:Cytochrome P450 n=1 Tax=Cannabis sativa TaxID=3483 RepID=A0A7J6G439_CANSA|nr:hypothetical protein G4B88_006842 [Cannabis sativa]